MTARPAAALAAILVAALGSADARAQSGGPGGLAAEEGDGRVGLDVERMPFHAGTIREVMAARTPEIQACYERVLAEGRKRPQGRVVVQFVIGREGNVQAAKVVRGKSTLRDPRVHACVLAVRDWQFPRPPDHRVYPVEYPFDLKVLR